MVIFMVVIAGLLIVLPELINGLQTFAGQAVRTRAAVENFIAEGPGMGEQPGIGPGDIFRFAVDNGLLGAIGAFRDFQEKFPGPADEMEDLVQYTASFITAAVRLPEELLRDLSQIKDYILQITSLLDRTTSIYSHLSNSLDLLDFESNMGNWAGIFRDLATNYCANFSEIITLAL